MSKKLSISIALVVVVIAIFSIGCSDKKSLEQYEQYKAIYAKITSSEFEDALIALEQITQIESDNNELNELKLDTAKALYDEKYFVEAKKILLTIPGYSPNKFLNSAYYKIEGKWEDIKTKKVIEIELKPNGKLTMERELYWSEIKEETFQETVYGNFYNIQSVSNGKLVLNIVDHYGNEEERVYHLYGASVSTSEPSKQPNNEKPSEPSNHNKPSEKPSEPNVPKDKLSPSEVYYWVQDRYDFYDRTYNKGVYSGDKFTNEVFIDAATHFNSSVSEVKKAYDAFRYR